MKHLRKLVRNGHSTQLTIPIGMLDHLRWRAGEPIVLELTAADTIEVRRPTIADLRGSSDPMELPFSPVGTRA